MTEQLVTFFGALKNITRVTADAQRQLDREIAPNFFVMKLLQPDENRLSDIIACLLDPAQTHGQGSLFFDRFVEMFKIPCPDHARRHVARELNRLDILVEIGWEKRFGIGIENKPRAADQVNQVDRYCEYLENCFPEQWWFGYLSGNGRPPPEHSIRAEKRKDYEANGRFRTIPFARSDRADEFSIEDWLARCVEVCVAERVRWFLRDMLNYVGTTFTNLESEPEP